MKMVLPISGKINAHLGFPGNQLFFQPDTILLNTVQAVQTSNVPAGQTLSWQSNNSYRATHTARSPPQVCVSTQ